MSNAIIGYVSLGPTVQKSNVGPDLALHRLSHALTRMTSSGCLMLHISEATWDVEQTKTWQGYLAPNDCINEQTTLDPNTHAWYFGAQYNVKMSLFWTTEILRDISYCIFSWNTLDINHKMNLKIFIKMTSIVPKKQRVNHSKFII